MEIREKLSNLLASYFLVHLEEEILKKKELVEAITIEGISFKEVILEMIENIKNEFPKMDKTITKYNFFQKWHDSRNNSDVKTYPNTTFKMFNQVFYARVLDLKYGSITSRENLKEKLFRLLGVGKSYGKDFTFGILFQAESKMKESIRILFLEHEEIDFKEAWKLILEQNEFYTETAYAHFDTLLKSALKKSDDLLLNILPKKIADELKQNGFTKPEYFSEATVLFTDFQGFTKISENMSPEELVNELDFAFKKFDLIISKYNLEKIKTIGDSYMCVAGVPEKFSEHAVNTCYAALEIIELMDKDFCAKKEKGLACFNIRIGIHSGPLVAGVIGDKKFAYDVWGDTVNLASRMESSGEVGKINISEATFNLVKNYFHFENRGKISAKNKGELEMYFLISKKDLT